MPLPGKSSGPKLVNRGPTGLLTKLPSQYHVEEQKKIVTPNGTNKISVGTDSIEIVDVDSLVPDPMNARLHPERNLQAIMESLNRHGQVKPLVVRRETNVVVAGNGTLDAAKKLGWTKVAVNFVEMNEADAAGYGLADNRTAELAGWDFEAVAILDKIIQEAGQDPVGWTLDELTVLRKSLGMWNPTSIENREFERQGKPVFLTETQRSLFRECVELLNLKANKVYDEGEALMIICSEWRDCR